MFSNHTKYLFLTGFVAVMVLMSAVIFVGYKEISHINQSMELIVNKYNAKTTYITTMYNAARERSIIILRMIDMDDPFDRDEEFLHFNRLATKFSIARIAMREIGFDEVEEQYSEEQYQLTQAAMPLLNDVIELLSNDELEAAKRLMIDKAIPAQDLVLEQLTSMLKYQDHAAKLSLEQANTSQKKVQLQITLMAIGAFFISLLIALFIYKHISRAKDALFAQVTLESIGDAVITSNDKGNIIYLNPLAEELTGWTMKHAIGKPISEVFNVTDSIHGNNYCENLEEKIGNLEPFSVLNEAEITDANGMKIAIDFSVNPILEKNGNRLGCALAFRNMSKERELRRQLSFQASHDALTGLINRYEFEERLIKSVKKAKHEHTRHALLYLDLDEFKVVNDTCGHIAGDELLRQIALIIKGELRNHDTIARLGGDEFGVILEDCASAKSVEIATKILNAIQDFHFSWEDKTFKVGVSIGIVEIDQYSKDIGYIMGIADTACYSAKDSGRNRVHLAEKNDIEIANRRVEMQWVSIISKALENNSFELHCQKIVPLDNNSNKNVGIELLLRMKNKDNKLISPGAFIPAAERYNLMTQIDRWVIQHAFEWLSKNRTITSTLHKCAINLSGQSFSDEIFLELVKQGISNSDIDPKKICFEITETAAISNLVKATHFITELKSMGCCFALDDFGSGLSSFAYLKNLPVDFIKIDGMFVKDIEVDPIDKEMVRSITSIAKAMGKETIAEFVESEAIKEILQEMEVDYIQGYAVEKPVKLSELKLS